MTPASRLIHTGNVIVDVVLGVDSVPPPGGDMLATSLDVTAGGGLNVIVAAVRDELPVLFTGRFGSGHYGSIVRRALESSGAELVNRIPSEQDSGFCIALVDAQAERTFVTYPGVEADLDPADLAATDVHESDLVYVTGYSLAHVRNAAALTGWLPSLPRRTVVYFDPSPLIDTLDSAVLSQVLGRTDIVSANTREGHLLTGSTDPASMARALSGRVRSGGVAIVRDGRRGCWIGSSPQDALLIPGFSVDAVDTNGAGDAHAGVLLAGISRGLSVRDAAVRANAAAALAVTVRGPATAPGRIETDQFVPRALASHVAT